MSLSGLSVPSSLGRMTFLSTSESKKQNANLTSLWSESFQNEEIIKILVPQYSNIEPIFMSMSEEVVGEIRKNIDLVKNFILKITKGYINIMEVFADGISAAKYYFHFYGIKGHYFSMNSDENKPAEGIDPQSYLVMKIFFHVNLLLSLQKKKSAFGFQAEIKEITSEEDINIEYGEEYFHILQGCSRVFILEDNEKITDPDKFTIYVRGDEAYWYDLNDHEENIRDKKQDIIQEKEGHDVIKLTSHKITPANKASLLSLIIYNKRVIERGDAHFEEIRTLCGYVSIERMISDLKRDYPSKIGKLPTINLEEKARQNDLKYGIIVNDLIHLIKQELDTLQLHSVLSDFVKNFSKDSRNFDEERNKIVEEIMSFYLKRISVLKERESIVLMTGTTKHSICLEIRAAGDIIYTILHNRGQHSKNHKKIDKLILPSVIWKINKAEFTRRKRRGNYTYIENILNANLASNDESSIKNIYNEKSISCPELKLKGFPKQKGGFCVADSHESVIENSIDTETINFIRSYEKRLVSYLYLAKFGQIPGCKPFMLKIRTERKEEKSEDLYKEETKPKESEEKKSQTKTAYEQNIDEKSKAIVNTFTQEIDEVMFSSKFLFYDEEKRKEVVKCTDEKIRKHLLTLSDAQRIECYKYLFDYEMNNLFNFFLHFLNIFSQRLIKLKQEEWIIGWINKNVFSKNVSEQFPDKFNCFTLTCDSSLMKVEFVLSVLKNDLKMSKLTPRFKFDTELNHRNQFRILVNFCGVDIEDCGEYYFNKIFDDSKRRLYLRALIAVLADKKYIKTQDNFLIISRFPGLTVENRLQLSKDIESFGWSPVYPKELSKPIMQYEQNIYQSLSCYKYSMFKFSKESKKGVDVTSEEMAWSAFGQGSNTAKDILRCASQIKSKIKV